jgi:predicted GNAT superfamily acetyltransferase
MFGCHLTEVALRSDKRAFQQQHRGLFLASAEVIEVRPEMEAVLAGIVRIAAEASLGQQPSASELDRLSQAGFLVSNYDLQKYRTAAALGQLFAILDSSGEPASFLLSYGMGDAVDSEDVGSQFIRQRFGASVPIIKQVATRPAFAGSGFARALYSYFIAKAARDVYAAIVKQPPNRGSEAFHERLGFSEAATFSHPDGKLRGIWQRLIDQDGPGSFE